MPSATAGNSAVQSAIPDLGNGSHSEAMKQIIGVIDKKVRNMEKKKSKLDDYQARKNKGERLNQDQLVRKQNGFSFGHSFVLSQHQM